MWINHKLVDFSNAAKMHRVTPGCMSNEEEADEARDVVEAEGIMGSSNEESLPQEGMAHEHSGTNPLTYSSYRIIFTQHDISRDVISNLHLYSR